MLSSDALQPGETILSRVSVYWTEIPGARPTRRAKLICTDRRLIVATPWLNPVWVLPLWPILGGTALLVAGVPGAAVIAAAVATLWFAVPWGVARDVPTPMVSRCALCAFEGWRRLMDGQFVEVTIGETAVWRFGEIGRGQRTALPIVECLQKIGLRVVRESGDTAA